MLENHDAEPVEENDDDRFKYLLGLEDEERERIRLRRLAEDEAEFVLRRIDNLEGREMTSVDPTNDSIALTQDADQIGISEQDLDD